MTEDTIFLVTGRCAGYHPSWVLAWYDNAEDAEAHGRCAYDEWKRLEEYGPSEDYPTNKYDSGYTGWGTPYSPDRPEDLVFSVVPVQRGDWRTHMRSTQ